MEPKRERTMSQPRILLAALMIAGLLGSNAAFAQTPTAAEKNMKQAIEDKAMKRKQAAVERKQKQLKLNECKKLAKEQKIPLRKRRPFVTECAKK